MGAQVGDTVARARRRQDHLRIGGDVLAQAFEASRRSARFVQPPFTSVSPLVSTTAYEIAAASSPPASSRDRSL